MAPASAVVTMNSYGGRRRPPKLKSVLHVVMFLIGIFWVLRLIHSYREFGTSISKSLIIVSSLYTTYIARYSDHNMPQKLERKVGKVMAVYGNRSIYERTLATHEEHSRQLGYPFSSRNPLFLRVIGLKWPSFSS